MPQRSNIDQVTRFFDDYAKQVERAALNSLDAAGHDAIDFAKSYTGKMVPPPRGHREAQVEFTTREGEKVEFTAYKGKNEGDRDTHPGGWADDTTQTLKSYRHDVEPAGRGRAVLTLENSSEHAALLERNGYWVLTGLTEGFLQERVAEHFKEALRGTIELLPGGAP